MPPVFLFFLIIDSGLNYLNQSLDWTPQLFDLTDCVVSNRLGCCLANSQCHPLVSILSLQTIHSSVHYLLTNFLE